MPLPLIIAATAAASTAGAASTSSVGTGVLLGVLGTVSANNIYTAIRDHILYGDHEKSSNETKDRFLQLLVHVFCKESISIEEAAFFRMHNRKPLKGEAISQNEKINILTKELEAQTKSSMILLEQVQQQAELSNTAMSKITNSLAEQAEEIIKLEAKVELLKACSPSSLREDPAFIQLAKEVVSLKAKLEEYKQFKEIYISEKAESEKWKERFSTLKNRTVEFFAQHPRQVMSSNSTSSNEQSQTLSISSN